MNSVRNQVWGEAYHKVDIGTQWFFRSVTSRDIYRVYGEIGAVIDNVYRSVEDRQVGRREV